jgi:excisionase family DNA binding protein
MRPRAEAVPAALDVRAFYKVAELARVAGVPTVRLLRLLRRNEIRFLRNGRAYLVSMADIYRKIPPLWEGLVATEALRRGQRSLECLE